ncbi:MAG: hypothetical protein M1517_02190 [Deltaproteobacteria bacterium]|nr:hypothetical protein [Deltaproteobacteria bacterium]
MLKKDVSRTFIWLEVVVGVLTLVYWVLFFFVPGSVQSFPNEPSYMIFERSFVAADVWMTIAYFLSAYYLSKKDIRGTLWGIVAGGTFVYLGCMDSLYNMENGKYAFIFYGNGSQVGMMFELVINLASFIFGAFTIAYVWKLMKAEADK